MSILTITMKEGTELSRGFSSSIHSDPSRGYKRHVNMGPAIQNSTVDHKKY